MATLGRAHQLEDDMEVSKATEHPLKVNRFGTHISLPFENDINFDYLEEKKVQNIVNAKPVVPFHLGWGWDIITRYVAPVYETTPVSYPNGVRYVNGYGDINPEILLTPSQFDTINWALGPSIFFPTASNDKYIGTGKYSIGPELGVFASPDKWVLGFLAFNVWSVAGNSNRPKVNEFSLQYFITYNFENGWFIGESPIITADWTKPKNEQWVVPLGLGMGKSFHIGEQPITIGGEATYNVVHPAYVGPNWQIKIKLEFLFPPYTMSI